MATQSSDKLASPPSKSSAKVAPIYVTNSKNKKSKAHAAAVIGKLHYHRSKFMRETQNGSRMVGGSKPTNLEKYNKFESTSYLTPDTAKQEALLMRMTKRLWTRRRSWKLRKCFATIIKSGTPTCIQTYTIGK